ncbi:MAG: hypothetical protein A3C35_03660 [Omnitrophica bacterium RIFCSPHIGHO2_02_FULL_46_11]|nr:MAG: hypothetical protein A3C35_03660 [Omnitrophica bacterium RIFCSPHIGHO2_02_FULL_46_11]
MKILILHVEAGYGHRKAAEAIADELRLRKIPGLEVTVLDALEKTNGFFRRAYPEIYFRLVLWVPWLWGFFYSLTNRLLGYRLIRSIRSFWNKVQSGSLREYIKQGQFDAILSTHFFPAEVCATAKSEGQISSTVITVVTDIIPHATWRNFGTDYYWVIAEESMNALAKQGVPRRRIYVGGFPVASRFEEELSTVKLRDEFGLKARRLTILFTSGSFGIGPTEATMNLFEDLSEKIQVIVVCGNNQTLFETLKKRTFSFPVASFAFVNNMHEMMSAADLVIAKPGGATTFESIAKGLLMIIVGAIPGQESGNAEWLLARKAAFQVKNPPEIKNLILKILADRKILDSARQSIKNLSQPHATRKLADFILTDKKEDYLK